MFNFLEKYFWLIGIFFALVNGYSLRARMKTALPQRPELEGYERFALGYTLFYLLPWIVMGVGIMLGGTRRVFDYLDPCSGNPYVIAFHLTIALLIIGLASWGWFFGGAAYLIRYIDSRSQLTLKLWLAGAVLALFFVLGMGCLMHRQTQPNNSLNRSASQRASHRQLGWLRRFVAPG
jgi:hypothetical protein